MGWWSLIGAGGPVLGVSLGAPIIQAFGWRALFWFQLALLVAAFAVVVVVLPRPSLIGIDVEARRKEARLEFRRMDWIGSWALSFSIMALTLGLQFGKSHGWLGPLASTCWVITAVALCTFIFRLRTAQNPLIPPHYFTKRNFVVPMIVRAACSFAYFGGFWLTPLLLQNVYGYGVGQTGWISTARPIVFAVSSPIAGYVAVRVGERVSSVAGAAFLTFSMIGFAMLSPSTGMWLVILALALSGLGMGVSMPSSSAIMANEVSDKEFGVMSAAQLVTQQVGQVMGSQILLSIQATLVVSRGLSGVTGTALLETFKLPFLIGGVVAACGTILAVFCRSVPRDRTRRLEPEVEI
jgi:MFS family permease